MPTSHTKSTIYNRALDFVSEYPVEGPSDPGTYARWLNRNYAHTVEYSLRKQPWNFACRFFVLQTDPEAPAMRWRYRYGLPNGWLRVLQPTRDGYREGFPIHYAVQGNYLMTNEKVPKGVELVVNVQEPGEWDPLFAEYIAATLATAMAQRFTAKNSYVDRCKQLAAEAYASAEEINAFEGSLAQPEEFEILRARADDDDYDRYNRGW